MKKVNLKVSVASMLLLLVAGLVFTGCGKDSTPPVPGTGGSIDAAIGTFKGKLTIYPPTGGSTDYFDAVVNVTKVSNEQLKVSAKSGEAYSIASSKTFTVNNMGGQAITHKTGSIEGHFIYKLDLKSLMVVTEQQAAEEVVFSFEGTKQ